MEAGRLLTIPMAVLASVFLAVFLFWFSGKAAPEQVSMTVAGESGSQVPGTISAAARIGLAIMRIAINDQITPNISSTNSSDTTKNSPDQNVTDLSASDSASVYTSVEGCRVSSQFPEKIMHWCGLITRYASERDLDPDLVAALILQESGGNSQAYSHSGAVGLMQVMPRDGLAASFQCPNGPCFRDRPTTQELKEPEFNIAYGTKMLEGLVNRRGSMREALKNYGPADVGYYYADIVLGIYEQYRN